MQRSDATLRKYCVIHQVEYICTGGREGGRRSTFLRNLGGGEEHIPRKFALVGGQNEEEFLGRLIRKIIRICETFAQHSLTRL